MISKDKLERLKQVIRDLYQSDSLPWVIGYSGGKDSTATLQLVWLSLSELPQEKLTKKVYVINTNTLVESPVVSLWVDHSLDLMRKAAKDQALPFEIHKLVPAYEDSFWVNLLGKGYPIPRRNLRWCTDRLKIRPGNTFIKNKIAEHGEIIMVLGTRKAESANRARTMERLEKMRVRELLSPSTTLRNEYVFSPLEDWTSDDVWIFLMQYKNPWGLANTDLMTLYKGATEDGECPIILDKSAPSCGNSRFGCWVCTVVSKDKSMEAMINNDPEKRWMEPMLAFRDEFGDISEDRNRRSFRKMHGQLQGSYGQLNHGPYKKEVREEWLKKLLTIQKEIQETAPEEYKNTVLISEEELRLIRRIWVLEKHEFDDSLPGIYKEVVGKEFYDPEWIYSDIYGQDEWEILKGLCQEMYPEETQLFELMYSLIDIEKRSVKAKSQKDVIEKLEHVVEANFYRNEQDAWRFYTHQTVRKMKYDQKFNSLFFKNIDVDDLEDDLMEEDEG